MTLTQMQPALLLAFVALALPACSPECTGSGWTAVSTGHAMASGGTTIEMCFSSTQRESWHVAQDYAGVRGLRFAVYHADPLSSVWVDGCRVPAGETSPCGELVLSLATPITGTGSVAVTGCSLTLACGATPAVSAISPTWTCSGEVLVSAYSEPAHAAPNSDQPSVLDRSMSGSFTLALDGPSPIAIVGDPFAVDVFSVHYDGGCGPQSHGGGGGID